MQKLVITNGTGGAGKDTFCGFVKEILEVSGYNVERYSYVNFTKWMLSEQGIDFSNKEPRDRKLLAGVNKLLEEYDDIPFKDCKQVIQETMIDYEDPYDFSPPNPDKVNLILLDVRAPKVIDRFKNEYVNVMTILIENGTINDTTEEDKGVSDYKYDYIISNTGDLDMLRRHAEIFCKRLMEWGDCYKKVSS